MADEAARRVLLVGGAGVFEPDIRRAAGEALVERVAGPALALQRVRARPCRLVVTDPATPLEEDLALLEEIAAARPGVRLIALAPQATPAALVAALRSRAFACFVQPVDRVELAAFAREALAEADWRDGVEVRSARPEWIALRVDCRRVSAERVVRFLSELPVELPQRARDDVATAFRELLLNAMEHGAGFDQRKVVEVAAIRTRQAIYYHVRDPGPGFRLEAMDHAAIAHPGDPGAHLGRRAERGLRPGGFGILLAQQLADELIYSETGNEVLLIKRLE